MARSHRQSTYRCDVRLTVHLHNTPDFSGVKICLPFDSCTDNFKPPAVANARGIIQQAASNNEYNMQLTSEVRSSLFPRPGVG